MKTVLTKKRKNIGLLGIATVVALTGALLFAFKTTPNTEALVSGVNWQAGQIIDDDIFYNNNAMSVNDIQTFLNQKVPNCDTNGTQMYNSTMTDAQYAATQGWPGPSYVCLKDYYQVPRSDQNINNLTTNVIPNGAISAAQIIKNAADTYGVNPQVLLVTLQKESLNLLNDNWPIPNQYRSPMGYGCSDSSPCDPQYEGFYNQVSNAARQFKLYKNNPNSYRYKPFQNNDISYQANAPSCGSSTVFINTYATAGLYNYTPYQPNQAALDNMYGFGDGCSAYGNRNFWRTFNDWFGTTSIPKSSEFIADGTYMIKNAASSRALDVTGGGTANGTRAQIYDVNGSNAQLWQTTRLSNGYYTIKNVGSGRYLDVAGGGIVNGTAVQIYDGNGGCAQQWAAVSSGSYISFQNVCSGKALDSIGGSTSNSTKLQIYDRNYSGAQLWSLAATSVAPLTNGYYKVSTSTNLKMSPATAAGDTAVQIASDLSNDTQTWQFYRQADGTYRIRNKSQDKLLMADNNGAVAGSLLEPQRANGTCAQSWVVVANSDGTYTLQSACYGNVIDVTGGNTSTVGTKLQVYGGNNTDAQKWHLTKVASIGISEGDFTLTNAAGKVLDIAGGGITINGTRLQIYDSNNTDAQKWHLAHLHDDIFTLSNKVSGKVIDINGGVIANGTAIQIYTSNATCAQQWQVVDNGDNTYSFASACDATKVLDTTGGNISNNGNKIQLYASNLSDAQKWWFVSLSP